MCRYKKIQKNRERVILIRSDGSALWALVPRPVSRNRLQASDATFMSPWP